MFRNLIAFMLPAFSFQLKLSSPGPCLRVPTSKLPAPSNMSLPAPRGNCGSDRYSSLHYYTNSEECWVHHHSPLHQAKRANLVNTQYWVHTNTQHLNVLFPPRFRLHDFRLYIQFTCTNQNCGAPMAMVRPRVIKAFRCNNLRTKYNGEFEPGHGS